LVLYKSHTYLLAYLRACVLDKDIITCLPLCPFGELFGCGNTMDVLGPSAEKYKSKVIAPRNPKRLKVEQLHFKVSNGMR